MQDEGSEPPVIRTEDGGRLTLTVPEAARLLGISRTSAYEAAHRGELPIVQIGRRMLVPYRALLRLLEIEQDEPQP